MATEEKTIRTEFSEGKLYIYPVHPFVKYYRFNKGEEQEAEFCHAMAVLAEKNGIDINEFRHLFTVSLRMLKSQIIDQNNNSL